MLKKSRKGFTLAELLIVVAIIAVLVAIAVPVFVVALDNAREGVFNANARSLKGLAVEEILTHQDKLALGKDAEEKDQDCWIATGYWDATGNLYLTGIKQAVSTSLPESTPTDYTAFKAFKNFGTKEGSQVSVVITPVEVPTSYPAA